MTVCAPLCRLLGINIFTHIFYHTYNLKHFSRHQYPISLRDSANGKRGLALREWELITFT